MSSTTGWYELLLAGSGDAVDALVAGIAPQQLYRGEDLGLHAGPLPERVLEVLGAKIHYLLFAEAGVARGLARRLQADPAVRPERLREVLRVSFAFAAEAYSHPVADKIRHVLHDDLPAGVELVDFKEAEERDPEAKGVELYADVHAYTYRATGRFTGPPPGPFELYLRLQDVDFVKEEELQIEGREVEAGQLGA